MLVALILIRLAIGLVIKFIRLPFCVPVDDVLLGQVGREGEEQKGDSLLI